MTNFDEFPVSRNRCDVLGNMSSPLPEDDSHERPATSVEHVLVICLIYGPIVLVTVAGNVIVIVAFVCDPAIRCRVSNLYILNLSVADLVIGLVCMGVNFVWLLTGVWPLGMIPCLIYLVVDFVSSYMSVLAVVLISLDRYRLVTLKLRYLYVQTRRRALVSISCCWCFCLVFYPGLIIGWSPVTGERNVDYNVNCDVEFYGNTYLNVMLILFEFVIPFTVLIYLNGKLYIVIRRRAMGFVWTHGPEKTVQTVSTGAIELSIWRGSHSNGPRLGLLDNLVQGSVDLTLVSVGRCAAPTVNEATVPEKAVSTCREKRHNEGGESTTFHSRPNKNEYLRHRKAAVTLSLIVGVYALCWLPFCVKNIIVTFCGPIDRYAAEVLDNLLWCNSTINPLLYALLSPRYRRFFVSVFRRLCCCRCRSQ
ncbi:histamine H3 receptor-like [Asterias rubens]|uniref:histamine H3 receptor-like n=1 Tax=Asterias rubens TaxID=7604 RepID=UPI0014554542|nr:histamine H3 receptor-like [Asterias rubens]